MAKILNFSGYKPTRLERAVSLSVAQSLVGTVNPHDPTTIGMAIANGFITGIAYASQHLTEAQKKALEKEYEEVMRRIGEIDSGSAPFQNTQA